MFILKKFTEQMDRLETKVDLLNNDNLVQNANIENFKNDTNKKIEAFQKDINTLFSLRENKEAPIITDLLKKIAILEGIQKASINRRTTEDIMHKLEVINDALLKADREDKRTDSLQEQVYLLKWVLGND